ncbi:MAG: hypothetical protein AAGI49_19035, partial [Bacteroidota bacterium]
MKTYCRIYTIFIGLLWICAACAQTETSSTTQQIKAAEQLYGLNFTDAERELMLEDVQENAAAYEQLRTVSIPNHIPMALDFNPIPAGVRF